MQCKELETVLEWEGLSPLPSEAREHLAGCSSCRNLLSDLSTIAIAAKCIPAEVTPPDRVWVCVLAQLETEGIVRTEEPVIVPAPAPWWSGLSALFRPGALATAGAGVLLVLGSVYIAEHRDGANRGQQPPAQTQARQTRQAATPPSVELKPVVPSNSPPSQIASARTTTAPQPRPSSTVLRRSPSEEAYLGDSAALLSKTENAVPRQELADNATVDASLRQNLRTLNGFIAECEARLKHNPQDQLTREYLNMAYQQKAELLTAMMDNGRSEH
jgi:hypothetical protein